MVLTGKEVGAKSIYYEEEQHMAERKAALRRAPERPHLKTLLDNAKTVIVTDDQLREQRASFVYGNAPKGSRITKESAEASVSRVRVTKAPA